MIRTSDLAAPAPRDPDAARHRRLLDRYRELVAATAASAPRFRLAAGDILALDNYRYLHGRDAYSGGMRCLEVLTAVSADGWTGY